MDYLFSQLCIFFLELSSKATRGKETQHLRLESEPHDLGGEPSNAKDSGNVLFLHEKLRWIIFSLNWHPRFLECQAKQHAAK